jgi:hypothetical protein
MRLSKKVRGKVVFLRHSYEKSSSISIVLRSYLVFAQPHQSTAFHQSGSVFHRLYIAG